MRELLGPERTMLACVHPPRVRVPGAGALDDRSDRGARGVAPAGGVR